MTFDPSHFAAIARALPSSLAFDKEARTRSAVGRAYYSLFLSVRRAVCVTLSIDIDHSVDHGELTNLLYLGASESGNAQLSAIAKQLQDAYEARRQADYKLNASGSWGKQLQKPAFADLLSRQVEETIKRLPLVDFKPLKGKLT